MMIFINHLSKQNVKPKTVVEKFVMILAPFALAGLGANHDRLNDRWIDLGGSLPFYNEVGTGSTAFITFSDNEAHGLLRLNGWCIFNKRRYQFTLGAVVTDFA